MSIISFFKYFLTIYYHQVDDADEDASGSVNFQEFVTLMLKRQEGGQTREEIKQVRGRAGQKN